MNNQIENHLKYFEQLRDLEREALDDGKLDAVVSLSQAVAAYEEIHDITYEEALECSKIFNQPHKIMMRRFREEWKAEEEEI